MAKKDKILVYFKHSFLFLNYGHRGHKKYLLKELFKIFTKSVYVIVIKIHFTVLVTASKLCISPQKSQQFVNFLS